MIQRAITAEEIAKKLKPLFGKKIDEIYFRYLVADSLDEKNEIFQLLSRLYQKHLYKLLDNGILLEPPQEESVDGEYPLGKISYAGKKLYNFSLKEKDWPRHMCITGMSGSGKTTFAFQILKNFIEKDKPFLVFDWKKSFRPLMGIDNNLMIFTVGNDAVSNLLRTNINRPPKGINPKEWINTLCDLITESFSASFGVHKIILETLDEAFEGWGIYNGGNHYPNWQHIKKLMEQKSRDAKGREMGWYESALRIASVMTFGSFGKSINYDGKRGLMVEDLFDKRVILELNSLSNIEKKFFSEYLLTYIFKLKKSEQNKVDEKFNYAILVDEAHNIFLKKDTNFMSESVTDMIYREMREYGSSLICLDQHVSKLSDTVTGNSACHVAFQQQLPQDIENISSMMQLRDKRELFSQIPVGQAIVKISERYTKPFLVDVPFLDLRKQVITDENIRNKMQYIIDGEVVKKYDPQFLKEIKNPTSEIKDQILDTQICKVVVPEFNDNEYSKEKTLSYILPKAFLTSINTSVKKKKSSKTIQKNQEFNKIENLSINFLNERQKILFNFTCQKQEEGMSLFNIEKLLEAGLHERQYSLNDIIKVINCAMKLQMEKEPIRDSTQNIETMNKEVHEVSSTQEEKKDCKISEIKNESLIKPKKELINNKSEEIIIAEKSPKLVYNNKQTANEVNHIEIIEENLDIISDEQQKNLNQEVIVIEDKSEQGLNVQSSIFNIDNLSLDEENFIKFLIKNPNHKNSTVELYKKVGLSARKGNVIKNKLMEKFLIKIDEKRTEKGWKKYIRLSEEKFV